MGGNHCSGQQRLQQSSSAQYLNPCVPKADAFDARGQLSVTSLLHLAEWCCTCFGWKTGRRAAAAHSVGRPRAQAGDMLYTASMAPIMEFLEDSGPGVHDTTAAACSYGLYVLQIGEARALLGAARARAPAPETPCAADRLRAATVATGAQRARRPHCRPACDRRR